MAGFPRGRTKKTGVEPFGRDRRPGPGQPLDVLADGPPRRDALGLEIVFGLFGELHRIEPVQREIDAFAFAERGRLYAEDPPRLLIPQAVLRRRQIKLAAGGGEEARHFHGLQPLRHVVGEVEARIRLHHAVRNDPATTEGRGQARPCMRLP